ncbi:tyrosine-type recombinase/integrase [Algibacter mikhailovii]|uniref:tyrosine-type recombinase/integrase n=1 Tax=Algibacter mikhailovii TaxID=425498 RepID=UPI0024951121|nr:tyrosine-type recombinase/integrase [Algibacter mikhailovii]
MHTLNKFITFEHTNEHDLEHDLAHKPKFSTPKINTANGNLSKRWYVHYSYRDPKTGKLKRMNNIYGSANSYKNKEDRLAVLSVYRKRLIKLLKEGYDPFIDNTAFHNSKQNTENNTPAKIEVPEHKITPSPLPQEPVATPKSPSKDPIKAESMSLKEGIAFSLELKKNQISDRTYKDYQYSSNTFIVWMQSNKPEIKTIDQINKKVAMDFLNAILIRSSARNRNNYRLNLSTLLQTLEDNEIILSNPMKKTPVLKSKSKRNKTYNPAEKEKIFDHLEKEDPMLLLFIKFFSYNFLRPVEACRLKIKDFDLVNKTIQFQAKNSPLKTKLIPQIVLDELPDLSKLDPEAFLFTPHKIGGFWNATEKNRSNYFSKQFNSIVKKHFKLDANQTMYSFRHTFTTKLYRALVKESSPYNAKSQLMQITGHSTMTALEKYLRDIDAQLPEDYSNLLKDV